MQTGDVIGRYTLGPQIGQGAFGNIFTARDNETGLIYAVKNESSSSERKSLNFEYKILRRIQGVDYFPKLFDYGEAKNCSYVVIELCGPICFINCQNIPTKTILSFNCHQNIKTRVGDESDRSGDRLILIDRSENFV